MLREVSIAAALCKAWSERELFYDAIYSLDALSEGGWNAAPPGTGGVGRTRRRLPRHSLPFLRPYGSPLRARLQDTTCGRANTAK